MVVEYMFSVFRSLVKHFQVFTVGEMVFYAVAKGRKIGIYSTWPECQDQVKGFQGAKFKKFDSLEEAQNFISSPCMVQTEPECSSSSKHAYNLPDVLSCNRSEPSNSSHGKTYYAVAIGRSSGIFMNWVDCKAQIEGLSYTKYKKFDNLQEAELFVQENGRKSDKTAFHKQLKATYPVPSVPVQQARKMSTISYSNNNFHCDQEGYVQVFTDGACENNGKSSAKAGIGVWFGNNHPMNVSEPVSGPATNNVAEIEAATRAIQVAKSCGISKVQINTDSQFLIRCINDWLPKWQSNGWIKSDGGQVINRVQLEELVGAKYNIEVKWNYVPGHRGIEGNEGADKLAREGALRFPKSGKSARFKPY